MKHTISCLVRNEPGVLAVVSGSFGDLDVNICSLAVCTTADPSVSRMIIVAEGGGSAMMQAEQVVGGLPNVIRVEDLARKELFVRELLLAQVAFSPESIRRLMQVVEMFDARTIGLTAKTMTVELAADEQRINAMLRLLEPFPIVRMARSGRIAVAAESES